ncbi:Baseplate J-like protein [uncultured Pleomorphomonas sp.]|uniref:Baseplate J-like protein n=1 Tax=uncultured Pleomorphomonas sp. TaxID=442121 RepID=A0A212L762_9HYPH|nr:baseplate J/gp47 family protein [uncultured Pleomorphomonas sp.]SCM73345.1 Baseplate J-like protein [uncultured Pleomorphomonas sp.]
MASTSPSINSLARAAWAAIRTYLPGSDAMPKKNTLVVLAKSWGLVLFDVHQRIEWTFRQIFASTADEDVLEKIHGYEENVVRKAASRATGTIAGTADAGESFAAGVRFLSGSLGYVSTAAATADGAGAISFSVRAEVSGASSNLDTGASLTLADPGSYLTLGTEFTTAAGVAGGTDRESLDDYRARILDRKRRPPQGGALSDYEQWAMEVSGVAAAWAARTVNSPGTVTIWVVMDGREDGIPTEDDVAVVQAYIDDLRRIGTDISVVAPVPQAVDITVTGLTPNTESVRSAIADELAALFAPDADGASPRGRMRPGTADEDFTLSRSWIGEAVSQAVGEKRHVLTAPAADLTFAAGQYPVLGTITYA